MLEIWKATVAGIMMHLCRTRHDCQRMTVATRKVDAVRPTQVAIQEENCVQASLDSFSSADAMGVEANVTALEVNAEVWCGRPEGLEARSCAFPRAQGAEDTEEEDSEMHEHTEFHESLFEDLRVHWPSEVFMLCARAS
mmetsp:Transcript_32612/g.107581  ORF Transcript_32612/g.107581 Transcript_32612/m.107581 type:complete len:139 (+) Transcript_32612:252-668(+)